MNRPRIACFALALVTTLFTSTTGAVAQRRARAHGCYGIRVSSPEIPTRRQRRNGSQYSATEILDLQFKVYMSRRLEGDHRLELKFFAPDGNLYRELELPFSIDTEASKRARRRRWRRQRTTTVLGTLPVGGTLIVNNSLYGTWRAEAYLDGAQAMCSAPRSFVINP